MGRVKQVFSAMELPSTRSKAAAAAGEVAVSFVGKSLGGAACADVGARDRPRTGLGDGDDGTVEMTLKHRDGFRCGCARRGARNGGLRGLFRGFSARSKACPFALMSWMYENSSNFDCFDVENVVCPRLFLQ